MKLYLNQNMVEINGVLIYIPSHLTRKAKQVYALKSYKQWVIDNIKMFQANVNEMKGQ